MAGRQVALIRRNVISTPMKPSPLAVPNNNLLDLEVSKNSRGFEEVFEEFLSLLNHLSFLEWSV